MERAGEKRTTIAQNEVLGKPYGLFSHLRQLQTYLFYLLFLQVPQFSSCLAQSQHTHIYFLFFPIPIILSVQGKSATL